MGSVTRHLIICRVGDMHLKTTTMFLLGIHNARKKKNTYEEAFSLCFFFIATNASGIINLYNFRKSM